MKIFDTTPKLGIPVSHATFYKAFLRMARAWENLAVSDGHVDWSNGIPTIVVDPGGAHEGGAPETTGAEQHMVYTITDDTTTPPTAGFDWTRWV